MKKEKQPRNPNQFSLEYKIDTYDFLDQFDRNQVYNSLMMLNQNDRESMRIYKKAQDKKIIL